MKNKKVGLQKFTEFDKKLDNLFKKETIRLKDIKSFTADEKKAVHRNFMQKMKLYKGNNKKLLTLINQVDPIMPKYIQNQTWEYNHGIIAAAISNLINKDGIMPDKNTIAAETGLSRQTIYNHIKNYATHPIFLEQVEEFKFLSSKLLARVYQCALRGDIRAAKLYFELIGNNCGGQPTRNTLIENQTNYIQINGTILTQENIKLLTSEQLNTIENMIKTTIGIASNEIPKAIVP